MVVATGRRRFGVRQSVQNGQFLIGLAEDESRRKSERHLSAGKIATESAASLP
jgi:hypothetical protein